MKNKFSKVVVFAVLIFAILGLVKPAPVSAAGGYSVCTISLTGQNALHISVRVNAFTGSLDDGGGPVDINWGDGSIYTFTYSNSFGDHVAFLSKDYTSAGTYTVRAQEVVNGLNTSCASSFTITATAPTINGACGSADGTNVSTAPSSSPSLCGAGTQSSVTATGGTNPGWTWSCNGSGGGTSASCSANKIVNGSCPTTAPFHYNCSPGTMANNVNGSTTWTWDCNGANGGTAALGCFENKNITYVVTASSTPTAGGSISPSSKSVTSGNTTTFDITPNSGYSFSVGGSCPLGSPTTGNSPVTYTTGAITGPCNVSVTFSGGGGGGSMSGTLTPASSSCTIAAGQSSCTQTLTWTTTNPVATSAVTSATGTPNPSTSVNNGSQTFTAPYNVSGVIFNLYNSGQLLAQATVNTNCVSGTAWDTGTGTCKTIGGGGMYGSLSPNPTSCTISVGQNGCAVNLNWSITNPEGTPTSITASGMTDVVVTNTLATPQSGTKSLSVPYPSRTFYLYNNAKQLDLDSVTASCASGTVFSGGVCDYPSGPVPVVSISANPTSSAAPVNPGLTWSATNSPSSCIASLAWSGAKPISGTNVSQGMINTPGTYRYQLICSNTYGDSAPASATVTVTSGGGSCTTPPALVSGSFNPTSVSVGDNVNIKCDYGITTNAISPGFPGATGCNFNNWTGTTANFTCAASQVGTYQVSCNISQKSPDNYCPSSANIGPLTVNSTGGVSGNLTVPSCTIASGGNSCNVNISWSTSPGSATPSSAVTSDYPSAGFTVANVNSGNQSVTVPYSSRNFYLYNNGVQLGSGTATATCASGTNWDGTKCAPAAPINGVCSASHYNCSAGTSVNNVSGATTWTWGCNGLNGGTNALSCSENKPNNATCGVTHYNCLVGGSYNNASDVNRWTWTCSDSLSGTSASCQEIKPGGTSGNLTASDCTILLGNSSCNSTVSWSATSNPNGNISSVTTPVSNTIGTGNSAGSTTYPMTPPGNRNFYLYNNGVILSQAAATATCALGTNWNGSTCAATCANGANNPPTCNTCTAPLIYNGVSCVSPSCLNGANNPPRCNTCTAPLVYNGSACVLSSCSNGATNPPTCTTGPRGRCLNGATNPPFCKKPKFIEN